MDIFLNRMQGFITRHQKTSTPSSDAGSSAGGKMNVGLIAGIAGGAVVLGGAFFLLRGRIGAI